MSGEWRPAAMSIQAVHVSPLGPFRVALFPFNPIPLWTCPLPLSFLAFATSGCASQVVVEHA